MCSTRMHFTILCVCLSLHAVRAAWSMGDPGVDRPYGDLEGMPLVLSSDNATECWSSCSSNAACAAWAFADSDCSGSGPLCWLKAQIMPQQSHACRISGVSHAEPLPMPLLRPMLPDVTPLGWLNNELQAQANGLSGHLQLFWADVENSTWIGGSADGGLHERTPYWLNGVVPMAYLLNDTFMISTVSDHITLLCALTMAAMAGRKVHQHDLGATECHDRLARA